VATITLETYVQLMDEGVGEALEIRPVDPDKGDT
jgi:hypothetical protein